MIKDPHDAREFRQWITFAADGSVAAVHEVEASVEQPLPTAVEVTVLGRRDWTKEKAAVLTPLRAKADALKVSLAAKGAVIAGPS